MKMKKGKTLKLKRQHEAKTRERNRLLFYRKLRSDKKFYKELLKFLINAKDLHNFDEKFNKATRLLNSLTERTFEKPRRISGQLSKMNNAKALKDAEDFVKKFNLGREWIATIIALRLKQVFYPPSQNLFIEDGNDGRVRLILNPDTTHEDIEFAFDKIEAGQKKLQPDFKKINITKKSFENFYENVLYDHIKMTEVSKANEVQLASEYEKMLWNQKPYAKETAKAIDKYRLETGRKGKFRLVTKVSEVSDKKIAEFLNRQLKLKGMKRMLNNIRQQRRRQKA